MSPRRALVTAALAALVTFTACDPPGDPGTGTTGGSGGTNPPTNGTPSGGTPSGGGGNSGGGAPAPFTISFDPTAAPAGVDRVELELNAIALFAGAASYRDESTPCDGGAGALGDVRTTATLPFPGSGPVPAVRFDRPAVDAKVSEVWLVFRQGLLHTSERSYKIHAATLCTMPDGMQYTLVRLRPGSPFSIGQGSTDDLVIPFDAGHEVVRARVDCRTSDAEECRTTDDTGDDGDPNTRLRFSFPTEFPVRVQPAG